MRVTIKDIAKKANVSITTVSRVLNNKRDGISEKTRKRILDIIEELDYRPNTIARSMITKQTNTIGLIIPDIRNPFFPELVRGIEDSANKQNYSVFLCNSDGDIKREKDHLELMKEKNVDGIIFTNSYTSTNQSLVELIRKLNVPVIMLDRGLDDESLSGVYVDNEKAGYLATKHLIELGHTKIGCITGPQHIQNSKDRLNGYLKALSESELPIEQSRIISGDYQMEGGYLAAKQLLGEQNITAVFALNDLMAFGVYQAAVELGIHIPGDLSVVGFDNLRYNQILNPKLTTIEQPVYKMGETAFHLLMKQLKEGKEAQREVLYLDAELIIRESTTRL